ncbi:MAG: T9SS type A sorting domain-containing protein [bacterium]|nr:T9SS type A sorting domain-containing protein [bacterium]
MTLRDIARFALLVTWSLVSAVTFAQPDSLWSVRVSAAGNPLFYCAIEHSSGDFICVGETNPGLQNSNLLISRIGTTGSVVWTNILGGTGSDIGFSCLELSGGDIVVAGCKSTDSLLLLGMSISGDSLWSRMFANGGQSCGYDAIQLNDGSIAVVGKARSADGANTDLLLLRFNPATDSVSTLLFGGDDTDYGYRIAEMSDGTLQIAGSTRSFGAQDYDAWLLVTDPTGMPVTSQRFGGTGADYFYDIDGSDTIVYLSGKLSLPNSQSRGYVVKANIAGDTLWTRTLSHGGVEDQFRALLPIASGNVLCAGWEGISWNALHCWLLSLDANGTAEWEWSHGSAGSVFNDFLPVSTGGYLAVGQTNVANNRRAYAVRLYLSRVRGVVYDGASGEPIRAAQVQLLGVQNAVYTNALGGYSLLAPEGDQAIAVSEPCHTPDTFAVEIQPDQLTEFDIVLQQPAIEYSSSSLNIMITGAEPIALPLTIRNTGAGTLNVELVTIALTPPTPWLAVAPDEAIVLSGDSLLVSVMITPNPGDLEAPYFSGDLYLFSNSCPADTVIIPVLGLILGAADGMATIPSEVALRVYPNPFNSSTTHEFSLLDPERVSLELFDITGRLITTFANDRFAPGLHRVRLDANELPSGIYFSRLNTHAVSRIQRLILIK